MKKTLAAVLILIAAVAFAWWRARPQPHPVRVVRAKRGTVESTVTATSAGTVTAAREVRMRPETTGRIRRILRGEGDAVGEGSPILELDSDILRARLAAAQAAAEVARCQVAGAKLWEKQAEDDYRRIERMYQPAGQGEAPMVSEQEYTSAKYAWNDGKAKVKAAEAEAARLEAEVALVEVEIGKMTICAPFAGTLTEMAVEAGETVSPATYLCELQETQKLQIEAPVDETDFGRVAKGMKCRLTLDSFPGDTFEGEVTKIAPKVIATREKNRTFVVTVAIADTGRLSPGLSADVIIVSRNEPDAVFVPTRCLRDGRFVYVVENGRATKRPVKTGVSNWETTQILDLPEGTAVVSLLDLNLQGELDGKAVVVTADEK